MTVELIHVEMQIHVSDNFESKTCVYHKNVRKLQKTMIEHFVFLFFIYKSITKIFFLEQKNLNFPNSFVLACTGNSLAHMRTNFHFQTIVEKCQAIT